MFKTYLVVAVITIIMIIAVIYGLIQSGSPFFTRDLKADQQKVTEITSISYGIQQYYSKNKNLPTVLDEITQFLYGSKNIKDFDTNQNYEYIVGEDSNYKLCSTFKTDTNQNNSYSYSIGMYNHTKGHYCFDLNANLYGLVTPIIKPQPATSLPSKGSFCHTLGTKMVVGSDGKGTIGCDVTVSKAIDLTKSYCEGQKSLQRANLVKDAQNRPNQYYVMLTSLDPSEEVKVFAYSPIEGKVECVPSLNNR